ncbi:MAG: SpoIIE family protein phosphatase [Gallionella sp.]|nr:SpoIIE family protein phosphatase [Gallionella sp.]
MKREVHDMNNEATRQAALDSLEILDTPPEERFDRITRLAKQLFGVETAAVSLIDHDRQWFKSKIGLEPQETPRNIAFCDVTIRESKNFTVPDARQDSRFQNNPLVTGDPNIRFYAGYPLETPSGERVGALCIFDPHPREFTQAEELQLRDLAQWVQKEMVIENELTRAAQIQKGFIPQQPKETFGYDGAGGCVQARTIGGDFYDWYPVKGGGDFTLADVMGKGMGAAIIAATVRAVLRAGSRDDDIVSGIKTAAAILGADLSNAGSFVTLFHARLHSRSGLIRYVDAGHGLSIVMRLNGEIERLSSDNPPLGVGIDIAWREDSFILNHGDTFISVSDGVLDLFDGTLRALDGVADIARSCNTAQEIVDAIITRAGKNADDDVTVLVLHRDLLE